MSYINLSLIYNYWFEKSKKQFGEKSFKKELNNLTNNSDDLEDKALCAELAYENLKINKALDSAHV
jgi:hypothetical protein|tara:strand:+ start:148 stop:345 length:198 start_codon:yes stop_codon:yes gene_type:complete